MSVQSRQCNGGTDQRNATTAPSTIPKKRAKRNADA
jgi:hypothetical protein